MNLATMIDEHPADDVAMVSRGETTTYGALVDQVARLRGGLASRGVGPDDRVGIVCATNWYFVVSYLATLGVGAVAVPLNPASPAAELEEQLLEVGASAVVVGPNGKVAFAGVRRDRLAALDLVVTTGGGGLDDAVGLEEVMSAEPVPVVDRADDDLAALIFTSGTAGSPKAAMLTHRNLLSNLEQAQRQPGRSLVSTDVVYGVLPLFHIFGLNVLLGLTLHVGASVVLEERFDPASSLDVLLEHGVTTVVGAPPMWAAWAAMPEVPEGCFEKVRLALSGAARLPDAVADTCRDRFGLRLSEGYGLTEASPIVTSSVGDEPRVGSVGRPLPGVEVRLVDTDGQDALEGDSGEVWVRGPNVFAGYLDDAEATAAVLDGEGWLHTGDIAVSDDDGYLYLVNRSKDVIIVSGFNVFPGEVEEVLASHAGIREVAVVGVPHPHTGEAVKAYVVVEPGQSFEEDLLIGFCEDRLARYKCPDKIEFVPQIPRGLGGKVLRRALR
ncbi:MAG TPA: AMP-binding protein [Acidimicrobiales bacterium]|jgi:long-chain acyl-CoA synthetase